MNDTMQWKRSILVTILSVFTVVSTSSGQTHEGMIVDTATVVLQDIAQIPAQGIPRALLASARGVAVIPGAIKLGFVAGFRGGRGIITMRDETGNWRPPMFITLSGGSVGWQAGIQSTDIVLVFKTQTSVDRVLRGKLTLGADASIAAGPVGRQAEAATDSGLSSEIFSYSRSRGIFAGVSLGGSVIQTDLLSNQAFYQSQNTVSVPGQPTPLPPSAVRFLTVLSSLSNGSDVAAVNPMMMGDITPNPETEAVRQSLIQSHRQLQGILDANWQSFLALPAGVTSPTEQVSAVALQEALNRYDTVAANPQFAALAQRPEFESTRQFLRRYVAAVPVPASPQLALPPPPIR